MTLKSQKAGELIWAASKGDYGAIHRLVIRGFDQDVADYDGRTPMHLAAAEGRTRVVEYFASNGASMNPVDRWGHTPLDDAVRHGHLDIAQLLAENGAIGGSRASATQTASAAAPVQGLPDGADIVEAIYAASEGDLPALQRLVARGVPLDGADYDYRTPLHLAAAEGHERVVQYFLDQGLRSAPEIGGVAPRWTTRGGMGTNALPDSWRQRHEPGIRSRSAQKAAFDSARVGTPVSVWRHRDYCQGSTSTFP